METNMKLCKRCNTEKELSEFSKNKTKKDGLSYTCTECAKEHCKNHYENNKELIKARASARKKRIQIEARKLVSECKQGGCIVCGESEECCLDFHHIDPTTKKLSVAEAQSQGYNVETIKKEIDKCAVVCSNCHRKIHKNLLVL